MQIISSSITAVMRDTGQLKMAKLYRNKADCIELEIRPLLAKDSAKSAEDISDEVISCVDGVNWDEIPEEAPGFFVSLSEEGIRKLSQG